MLTNLKNEKGFGVAEVSIFFVAVMIISYSSIFYSMHLMKSNRYLDDQMIMKDSADLVRSALKQNALCQANLNMANLDKMSFSIIPSLLLDETIKVSRLTYLNGDILLQAGVPLPQYSNLSIENTKITKIQPLVANSLYSATLNILFKRNGFSLGSPYSEKNIKMYLHTIVSGDIATITGCSTSVLGDLTAENLTEIKKAFCIENGGSFSGSLCTLPTPTTIRIRDGSTFNLSAIPNLKPYSLLIKAIDMSDALFVSE